MIFRLFLISILIFSQFAFGQPQRKISIKYVESKGTHKVAGSTQDFCFTSNSELVFTFSVEGKPGVNDWIGIFESDDCDHSEQGLCYEEYHDYDGIYLREETHGNVTLKAPQPLFTEGPVTYRVYYFTDDTYSFVAKTQPFQIETCPGDWTLKFSPANENLHRNCFSISLDGKISIDFNIEKPHTTGLKDWIGFYEFGRCTNDRKNVSCPLENEHEEWAYLNGLKSPPPTAGLQSGTVSVPIPTKKGIYVAYYFIDGSYHWVSETSPFAVECNVAATYTLELNSDPTSDDDNHTHAPSNGGCVNTSSHVHLHWAIDGEISTLIDWVGFYKEGDCDETRRLCPHNPAAWAYLDEKRYFEINKGHHPFVGKPNGSISIPAPDITNEANYVAYYFVNDDYYFVAKSKPFVVKTKCTTFSLGGYGFAAGMGALAIIGVLVIILVVIIKKYFLDNNPASSPGVKYDQINRDDVHLSDDSLEEYNNQISISASSGEDDY